MRISQPALQQPPSCRPSACSGREQRRVRTNAGTSAQSQRNPLAEPKVGMDGADMVKQACGAGVVLSLDVVKMLGTGDRKSRLLFGAWRNDTWKKNK